MSCSTLKVVSNWPSYQVAPFSLNVCVYCLRKIDYRFDSLIFIRFSCVQSRGRKGISISVSKLKAIALLVTLPLPDKMTPQTVAGYASQLASFLPFSTLPFPFLLFFLFFFLFSLLCLFYFTFPAKCTDAPKSAKKKKVIKS